MYLYYSGFYTKYFSFTLYAAHRREPSVKTLRFQLSAKLRKHCMLRSGTQGRSLTLTPERRNGNIYLKKYFISSRGIEPTTCHAYDWLPIYIKNHKKHKFNTFGIDKWKNCKIVSFIVPPTKVSATSRVQSRFERV